MAQHYYEKNIVDIKKEYTDYLISIITPFLYEGIQSVYEVAKTKEQEIIESAKNDPQIEIPSILILFQLCLKNVNSMTTHLIEKETKRIRDQSQCADFFDDLLKAVIKSHIVLLTYNASDKQCKLVNEKFHQNIVASDFIHKCYIESARIFYDHPELFWHEFNSTEIKYNQRVIHQLIKVSIIKAIRSCLPMKLILEEYLGKDYIATSDSPSTTKSNKYQKIKELIKQQIHDGDQRKIMESDSDDTSTATIHGADPEIDLNDFIYKPNTNLDKGVDNDLIGKQLLLEQPIQEPPVEPFNTFVENPNLLKTMSITSHDANLKPEQIDPFMNIGKRGGKDKALIDALNLAKENTNKPKFNIVKSAH